MRKQNMKSFSNETLNFIFKKFWASYVLHLAQTAVQNMNVNGINGVSILFL